MGVYFRLRAAGVSRLTWPGPFAETVLRPDAFRTNPLKIETVACHGPAAAQRRASAGVSSSSSGERPDWMA